MVDRRNNLVPISLTPPERSYRAQVWRDMTGVARFLGEVILIDSVYVAAYAGQSVAPTLLAAARAIGETVSNPTIHKWILVWAAFLFFTCY